MYNEGLLHECDRLVRWYDMKKLLERESVYIYNKSKNLTYIYISKYIYIYVYVCIYVYFGMYIYMYR